MYFSLAGRLVVPPRGGLAHRTSIACIETLAAPFKLAHRCFRGHLAAVVAHSAKRLRRAAAGQHSEQRLVVGMLSTSKHERSKSIEHLRIQPSTGLEQHAADLLESFASSVMKGCPIIAIWRIDLVRRRSLNVVPRKVDGTNRIPARYHECAKSRWCPDGTTNVRKVDGMNRVPARYHECALNQ